MYAIKNKSRFIAQKGRHSLYTDQVRFAEKFETKEQAQNEACGDETVIELHLVWGLE